MKILIAGIGGVGGFFGGKLAKQFESSSEVEVHFLARGQHLKNIQNQGLKVMHLNESFVAKPTSATDSPSEVGACDWVIIATKSYDLPQVLEQLKPCIDKRTKILPLLNGVNHLEIIQKVYPENRVVNGCVYIVSRLKQPGVIENSGSVQRLFFGDKTNPDDPLKQFEQICLEAGIEVKCSENIETIVWEKFVFLSPIATATSFFNQSIGALLQSEESRAVLLQLLSEVCALANALKIDLPADIEQRTIKKWESFSYETTTSMHSDYIARKPQTEVDSLTGYVWHASEQVGLKAETYKKLFKALKSTP